MKKFYLNLLSLILLGYAVLGKSFAYLGFGGVYVSEVVLLLGILILIFNNHLAKRSILFPVKIIILLILWGLIRSIPFLRDYGKDVLRDAVLWGYSLYAIIIFSFIDVKELFKLLRQYIGLVKFYPPFVLILRVLIYLGFQLPMFLNTGFPIIYLKTGDISVHLAGVTIFSLLLNPLPFFYYIILAMDLIIIASSNRGGMLSYLISVALVFVLYPRLTSSKVKLVTGVVLIMVLGIMSAPFISLSITKFREVSIDQVITNVVSIFSSDESIKGDQTGTKNWRLSWWNDIVSYTFTEDYFFTGKGFGVNLADEDGYQVDPINHSLRSPHSVHMNFLARTGVPGFLLWIAVVVYWFVIMYQNFRDALGKNPLFARIFLFFIGYMIALLINASFDVFLEGPMGGVWFWVIYGIGLASLKIYHSNWKSNGFNLAKNA